MPIIICLLVLKHFSVDFLLPGDGYGSEIVGELCFCSGTELILLLGLLNPRVGDSLLPVHNHMLCFSWCFSVLCCFDDYSPVALCMVIDWIGIIVDSRLVWWNMALQADWCTFHHIVFFDNLLLLLWVRFAVTCIVLSCVFFSPSGKSMSSWIVLLLGSPFYCTCGAHYWDKMYHVKATTWQLIMILSMLIHGPGDDLFLCGASASAGPMMTNCFQSLWRGPCKCYTRIPD